MGDDTLGPNLSQWFHTSKGPLTVQRREGDRWFDSETCHEVLSPNIFSHFNRHNPEPEFF